MTDISVVSRVRITAGTRRNNSKKHCEKQQEDNSGGGGRGWGDICYLENICGAGVRVRVMVIEDELYIDAGKHVLFF